MGKIEKERKSNYALKKWLTRLEMFKVSQEDFEKHRKTLSNQFRQEASVGDTVWGIFNKLLLSETDLHTLKMIYFTMALLLDEEGKDSYEMHCQATKMQLLKLKESSSTKQVEILSTKGCSNCEKYAKKIFTIEDALEKMPIPRKDCTFHLNNNKYGYCRCIYIYHFD